MPNTMITTHFSLHEWTFSETAIKHNIDNTPNFHIIANITITSNVLEKIRASLGVPIKISSGYRCEALNKAVGGSKTSAHVQGYAADIKVVGMSSYELVEAVLKMGIKFDQLINEPTWVHIGLVDNVNNYRNEVLTYRGGKYLKGNLNV